jgi:ABC-type antimicrobial peptide transport system permease subunit
LYGVVTYTTARRRAEIGLRMALGASQGNVLWLVLKDMGITMVAGAVIGLTTAYFAGRLVKSLVFGVQPTDPAIIFVALATLTVTAAIAAYLPARRASRSDPMEALRIE